MDENNPQLSRILSASSLLLALLIGGYVLYDQPFQSERTASGLASSLLENRLWEDPLKPIFTIRDREEQLLLTGNTDNLQRFYAQYAEDQTEFRNQHIKSAENTDPNDVMIMGVMVPSSRFTLSSELRRRIRYAVLSALNQTHVPNNSENLSVLRILPDAPADQSTSSDESENPESSEVENESDELPAPSILISYEVLNPYRSAAMSAESAFTDTYLGKTVILLWMPEDIMQDTILEQYANILESVYGGESGVPESILIGPTSSNGLVRLYSEIDLINEEFDSNNDQFNSTTVLTGPVSERLNNLDLSLPLRSSIENLLIYASNYLDNSMSEANQMLFVDCYAGTNLQARLSQEFAVNCLTNLNIDDSDASWELTVASSWPPQLELELIQQLDPVLQVPVIELLQRAEAYLDYGLSENDQSSIVSCFLTPVYTAQILIRDSVSSCLSNLEISDSDAAWYEYISSDYPSQASIQELAEVPLSIQGDVLELVNTANEYLDNGLSDEGRRLLIACYQRDNSIDGLNRENVENCLFSLRISDSDDIWFTTLANRWPEPSLPPEFDELPETIRNSVATLIESSNSYLDSGLDEVKRLELIQCFRDRRNTLELNQLNVSQCLRALGIEDSNPYWFDYIASEWPAADPRQQIVVISPRATISPEALQAEVGKVVRDPQSQVIRSITSDEKLLQAIYEELDYRKLTSEGTRIALIYESDGTYGRALESELRCDSTGSDYCFTTENVDSYGYLRGIDGLLANESSTASSSANNASETAESLLNSTNNLEEPIGQHQYDYLRRLATEVSEKKYDVIGVLGTDIFDKLLVLQALRERNPDAVFFTTDLDSFMGHGAQSDWSQNLLVASAFALVGPSNTGNACNQVDDDISTQRGISVPPFRDSYQTSYFYSTCLALRLAENGRIQSRQEIEERLASKVYLYEIGRNEAVLLPERNAGAGELSNQFRDQTLISNILSLISWALIMSPMIIIVIASSFGLISRRPVLLTIPHTFQMAMYLSAGSFLGVVITLSIDTYLGNSQLLFDVWLIFNLILYAVSLLLLLITGINLWGRNAIRQLRLDQDSALIHCLFISLATIVTMCTLLITEIYTPGGEPVRVFTGISHWPTTLIRIQIFSASICFAIYSYSRWQLSNETLSRFIPHRAEAPDSVREFGWSINGWKGKIDADNDQLKQSKHLSEIWHQYCDLGTGWKRLLRVLTKSIFLVAILFATYYWLTPQPALIRSSYPVANLLFSNIFVLIVTFTAVFMIVLGNDVTRLSATFIRALRKYNVVCTDMRTDEIIGDNFGDSQLNNSLCVLEIIAKRSEAITPLVFFPFLIIFLMIASRSTLFEGWEWSLELVIVFILFCVYFLYSAISMQREAGLARKQVLATLGALPRTGKFWELDKSIRDEKEAHIKAASDHVSNLNRGAFVVWYKHPLFQSLALPTSGTSGLFLLQYLS